MSVTTITGSRIELPEQFNQLPVSLQNIARGAIKYSPVIVHSISLLNIGASAATAGLFTAISPLGGAIFAVSESVTRRAVSWICDKVNCCPDSLIAKVARFVLPTIAGIGAGYAVLSVGGFPVTITSAVGIYVGGILLSSAVMVAGVLTVAPFVIAYVVYDTINNPQNSEQVEIISP